MSKSIGSQRLTVLIGFILVPCAVLFRHGITEEPIARIGREYPRQGVDMRESQKEMR